MTKPIVWRGPEALRAHLVPLSSIRTHPDNPKDHDLGAIAASLARFGQKVPLVVQRSTGWIVAGNGRWEAIPMVAELEKLLEVGPGEPWTHVAAIFDDLADLEAKAYALADNRTHDLGGYHEDRLAALLTELASSGDETLVATGYDEDDVENLLASLRPRVPGETPFHGRGEGRISEAVEVRVRCSRSFLAKIQKTLGEWQMDPDVRIEIVNVGALEADQDA